MGATSIIPASLPFHIHTLSTSLQPPPYVIPSVAGESPASNLFSPLRFRTHVKSTTWHRSVAQLARALVSKTKGRGFESCRSCHNSSDSGASEP